MTLVTAVATVPLVVGRVKPFEEAQVELKGMDVQTSVSPREAARLLGIRLDAVYGLIWSGKLKAEKRDGRWLVGRAAVDTRIRDRTTRRSHDG